MDNQIRDLVRDLAYDAQMLQNEISENNSFNIFYFGKIEGKVAKINKRLQELREEAAR